MAASIGDEQGDARRLLEAGVEYCQRRSSENDEEIGWVLDPKDRMTIEQDVARRAAADSRNDGDHRDSKQIKSPTSRGQGAAYCEHGDPRWIKQV